MSEIPSPKYEHEQTLFSEQEFWKHFNNFHLIFTYFDDPEYLTRVTIFLKEKCHELSRSLVEKMKEVSGPSDIDESLKPLLYTAYLQLRNVGGFSNKELGLTYW